jgi:plastocyanin
MKKIYSFVLFIFSAFAINAQTVHTITVENYKFTPQNISTGVAPGDIILFQWLNGTHTSTSVSIPAGATAWDQPMTSGSPTYSFVVTVPGSYGYKCTPHATTMFMVGGFTVGPNAVPAITNNYLSNVFPNPFSGKITIETPMADLISIYNIMGVQIKSIALKNGQTKVEVDAADLTDGIYFYSIIREGVVIETRKIVKD